MSNLIIIVFLLSLFFIPSFPCIIFISLILGFFAERFTTIKNYHRQKFLEEVEEIENLNKTKQSVKRIKFRK